MRRGEHLHAGGRRRKFNSDPLVVPTDKLHAKRAVGGRGTHLIASEAALGHLMRGAIGRALRCTQRSTQRSPQSSHMSACNEGGSRDAIREGHQHAMREGHQHAMREGHQHAMREGHQHAMREAVGMQSWLPRPPDNRSARAPDEGCNQAGHERQSMANEGDNRSSTGAVSSTSASTCSKSGRVLPARKCSRRRRAASMAACTRASRAVGASTAT